MWCNELSKNIIKECIVQIDNKPIQYHCLNSEGEIVTKNSEGEIVAKNSEGEIVTKNSEGEIVTKNSEGEIVTKHINENYLICKSNKKDESENNYFDIEEKDIKLVMDKTNLNRERAINELQKKDIVTVLMNYMN